MRLKLLFFCISFVLLSCGEKVIEPPENLISKEKMASILYDMAILNSTKGTSPSLLSKNNIEVMPFIFRKYDIDSIQFTQSDVYYASVPLEYQAIYENVEARLENEVKLLEEQKKRKNDSIKKANEQRRDSIKKPSTLQLNDSLSKK
ncbi:DUF4296 domain-containing protein [Croceitalea marina]|uniref:DUF4296 domain-containing protein n=1 Tax=Croceitalea marina TaxID=1775166 RepID=A0ABW5MVU3_9FLAO